MSIENHNIHKSSHPNAVGNISESGPSQERILFDTVTTNMNRDIEEFLQANDGQDFIPHIHVLKADQNISKVLPHQVIINLMSKSVPDGDIEIIVPYNDNLKFADIKDILMNKYKKYLDERDETKPRKVEDNSEDVGPGQTHFS